MTDTQNQPHLVTAIFHAVDPFKGVLKALIDAGFGAADVSILGSHEMISDHFDGAVRHATIWNPRPPRNRRSTRSRRAFR